MLDKIKVFFYNDKDIYNGDCMNFRKSLFVDEKGNLIIGGVNASWLAKEFGTPLYAMDEEHIRSMCRVYRDTVSRVYGDSLICYASKAFSATAIYSIIDQEGLGTDCVSGGEFFSAINATFNPEKVYFHGCNKTTQELDFIIKSGVGHIVIDSLGELSAIDYFAKKYNKIQKVLVRINPGVEAHTHSFIQTAKPDSKFGISIADGEAQNLITEILKYNNILFDGLHCHIGSQLFDKEGFCLAIEKCVDFIATLDKFSIKVNQLNLGGGIGIYYNDEDPTLDYCDYEKFLTDICEHLLFEINKKGINKPKLILEPGRSIVGESGITIYSVGNVKDIKGIRKYVMVDGGMFENPRYALYGAKYSALVLGKGNNSITQKVTIAGKCCESGDIIATDVPICDVENGDKIAVFSTGAYNYSMASNYNRNLIPPVVMVYNGQADYIVKPQTYLDIVARDVIPNRLKEVKNDN